MADDKKIKLLDLVDLEILQKIQDAFANAMNMGCLIVDGGVPITKPSKFLPYCTDFIMSNEKGLNKCNESIFLGGKKAAEKGGPYIFKCHAGLTHFAVPIIVEGENLATIIGGQFTTEQLDKDFLTKAAIKLDIDPEKIIEASKEVPLIPSAKVESAAQLLYLVANNISTIAHKNLTLMKKNKEDMLYRKINDAIRNILDLDEMKKKILEFIGKTLEADRCFIIEYDKDIDKFLIIKDEYVSSKKTPSYLGSDVNIDVPNLIKELKDGKYLIIKDKEIYINGEKREYEAENSAIEKYKVNSAYAVPFFYEKNLLGVLAVHYLTDKHKITKEEIDFMLNLANRVAVGFYQVKLYEKLKRTIANQNAILNNMPFMAWLKNKESVLLAANNAFAEKCNTSVENLIGKTDFDFFPKEEADVYFKADQTVMQSKLTVASNEVISGADGTKWYETYKSPVIDNKGNVIGTVGLSRDISEMIDAEAEILNKQKQIVMAKERETLLRKITETIIDSTDIDVTKQRIVELVGKTLNIDRVIIVEYDIELKKFLLIEQEYLSSDNVLSAMWADANEIAPNFVEDIVMGKSTLVNNGKVVNIAPEQEFEQEKDVIQNFQVDSLFNTPLMYKKELLGVLSISYIHEHFINDEEIALIKTVARQISIAIYQARLYNQTQIQLKKEQVIKNIIEKTIRIINEEEIMNAIVTGAGELLNADRCFFVEYDYKLDTSLPIKPYAEYLSSNNIKSHVLVNPTKESVGVFLSKTKNREKVIVDNIEKVELPPESRQMLIEYLDVKSYLIIPVYYEEQFYGSLVFHYVKSYKKFSHDDIDIAEVIAKQAASAIYQSRLFIANSKKAEREQILSRILSKAISTFDINEIKQVVEEIGQLTKADRCYFVEVDLENMKGKPIDFDGEYRVSDDIKSIIGYEFPSFDVQRFVELYSTNKNLVVFDYEELSQNKDEYYKGINAYSNTFGLKSGIGIPFIYMNRLTAVLCIEYVKEKVIPTSDELEFLKILGNQIGVIFNQIQQFKNANENAQREQKLRMTIETLRSSLDLVEVKEKITKLLGQMFNADRCYFRSYDVLSEKFLAPDVEYLSSSEVSSLKNVEPDQEGLRYFAETVKKLNRGFYPVLASKELAKDTPLLNYLQNSNIAADYAIPIISRYDELTWLVFHYIKSDPKFTNEDKKLMETIGYQIDIAFEQIKLYAKTKAQAEREALLRNITDKIRQSLDIEEIMTYICEEVSRLFDVQRVAIVMFPDINDYKKSIVKKEYLVSQDIKGLDYINDYADIGEYWGYNLTQISQVIAIDNIAESNTPDFFKNSYIGVGIKSMIGVSIQKGGDIWGTLVLSEYEKYRQWSEEEKVLLKTISDQVYIAINQAELYEKEKLAAERERISRNIIEILRSSIDKTIIKKLFVKNIGKFFNADRVFFSDYDENQRIYLPVDENSEYLSSINEKSFIGFDWSNSNIQNWIRPLLEKREIKVVDWDEYVKEGYEISESILSLYRETNIKSKYGFPVIYQDKIMGFFCIEFTQQVVKLTDEDIGRIRSICTQAGIALYHADLYSKAQECYISKESYKVELLNKIEKPAQEILDISLMLTQNDFERQVEIEYLNNIISSCNQLLELTHE